MSHYKRGFYWDNRAYYARSTRPEVTFGMYSELGGTTGEMTMRWVSLSGGSVPKLEVFNDAWGALASFTDLGEMLKEVNGQCITDQEFVNILLACGFEDLTHYTKEKDG